MSIFKAKQKPPVEQIARNVAAGLDTMIAGAEDMVSNLRDIAAMDLSTADIDVLRGFQLKLAEIADVISLSADGMKQQRAMVRRRLAVN